MQRWPRMFISEITLAYQVQSGAIIALQMFTYRLEDEPIVAGRHALGLFFRLTGSFTAKGTERFVKCL